MGNVGPVSLLGQYVDVDNTLDSYNLKADVSVDMIKAGVEYSETDADANSNEYQTLKAYVSAKAGIVSGTLTYASTGDNGAGSLHAVANNAGAIETPAEYLLWQLGSYNKVDLDLFAIDATVALTDKISLRAAYADAEYGATDIEASETLGQIGYKVSKNLNTYFRYSVMEDNNVDTNRGRIEVKYTF